MSQISELITDPASGLSYRTWATTAARPTSLLLLLHGVGGDESNLASVAGSAPENTLVVLVRGRLKLPNGFGWFHVAFTPDGPRIAPEEADDSRKALIVLIKQLQTRFEVVRQRTIVAGFSQGGILSSSVGLSAPHLVAGFGILSGRILPELEPSIAPLIALAGLHAFISHGRLDRTLSIDWATRSQTWLEALHVRHELKLFDGGHELNDGVILAFAAWLGDLLRTLHAAATLELELGTDATTVRSDSHKVAHRIAPGPSEVVERYLGRCASLAHGIELAIAAVEDELALVYRALNGRSLSSRSRYLHEIARAAGLAPGEKLSRQKVEEVFMRQADVASGRPASQERLPTGLDFVAGLVITRELMHHLGVEEISLSP